MEGQEDVHLVFSTGCSVFQDWQSYGFFFQAWQSGHEGHVTRVASGCEEEDAQQLLLDHDRLIVKGMSNRFHLHLTPDYSKSSILEKDYKFFNKPWVCDIGWRTAWAFRLIKVEWARRQNWKTLFL